MHIHVENLSMHAWTVSYHVLLSDCVLQPVLWAQTAAELQLVSFPRPCWTLHQQPDRKMPKSCAAKVQLPALLLQPLHLTLAENGELERSALMLNSASDENTVQRSQGAALLDCEVITLM